MSYNSSDKKTEIHSFHISPAKTLVHNPVVLRFPFHIFEHYHSIHFEDLKSVSDELQSSYPLLFSRNILTLGKSIDISFKRFSLRTC